MGGGVWQDKFDETFTPLDDDYYVSASGWSSLISLFAPFRFSFASAPI
jgi:hypothetical protein